MQPFLMRGIEDKAKAKSSAFGAMFTFLLVFIASCYGIYHDNQNKVEKVEEETGYNMLQSEQQPGYGATR